MSDEILDLREDIRDLHLKIDALKDRVNEHVHSEEGDMVLFRQHMEETRHFRESLRKTVIGIVTLGMGGILGLLWEYIKAHMYMVRR